MQNIHKMSETPILAISVLTLNVLLLNIMHKIIFGLIFLFYHVVWSQSAQLLPQVSRMFLYSTENTESVQKDKENIMEMRKKSYHLNIIFPISAHLVLAFILNLKAVLLQ